MVSLCKPHQLRLCTGGILSLDQKADSKTIYNTNHAYKDMENNIQRTVNTGLNRIAPDDYKITSTMVMIGQG